MAKKTYDNKKLTETAHYNNYGDVIRSTFSWWQTARIILVLCCIGGVLWMGRWVAQALFPVMGVITDRTTTIVSKQIGTPPALDAYGSLNILLMGYGGATHQGGFLTDSLMVASFHPENGAVTLLSIPRDLWVTTTHYEGRINSLFPHAMISTGATQDITPAALDWSARETMREIEDITGLDIPYYALVSFDGFEDFVNELGGVTIEVPETLTDYQFPDANMKGYDPLIIEKGLQIMDGTTALKYARSRKSTSDFSRSYRQQQIIEAIIAQVQGSISLTNINKMERLYDRYQSMIQTNLTIKHMLHLLQYKDNVQKFASYVLSYECGAYFTQMIPGCFLTTPPRDWFGGASVLTPLTTTANNLSNYTEIRNFIYLMIAYPTIATEGGDLTIYNAISKEAASNYRTSVSGKANDVASKLVQYGFSVYDIFNAPSPRSRTVAYIYGSGDYSDTIEALKLFMDIDIYTGEVLSGHTYTSAIDLYLGDSFLDDRSSPTNRFWNQ